MLENCRLILDWCILASHQDSTPTTSILALTMHAALADDEVLGEWLIRRLAHTIGQQQPASTPAPAQPRPLPPRINDQPILPPGPPPDCGLKLQPNSHTALHLLQLRSIPHLKEPH